MARLSKIKKLVRTKQQRIDEVRPVIEKITQMNITVSNKPIQLLFQVIKDYIDNGERFVINIPFPDYNKRILGVLATDVMEEVWVKLENETF